MNPYIQDLADRKQVAITNHTAACAEFDKAKAIDPDSADTVLWAGLKAMYQAEKELICSYFGQTS